MRLARPNTVCSGGPIRINELNWTNPIALWAVKIVPDSNMNNLCGLMSQSDKYTFFF